MQPFNLDMEIKKLMQEALQTPPPPPQTFLRLAMVNPTVFFDIAVDTEPLEHVSFEPFAAGRKLLYFEHWGERICLQRLLLSQNYSGIYVPGW